MGEVASAAMGLTMLAAALLLFFGVRQAMAPPTRKRGLLMIVCGVVFIANVLILTL